MVFISTINNQEYQFLIVNCRTLFLLYEIDIDSWFVMKKLVVIKCNSGWILLNLFVCFDGGKDLFVGVAPQVNIDDDSE